LPVLALALVLAIAAVVAFRHGEVERTLWRAVAASVLVSIAVFGLTTPVLRALKLSPRLADAVRSVSCDKPQTITAGYREPSLVFLVGTDLAMAPDGTEAARFLTQSGCRVALVEQRLEPDFVAALAVLPVKPRMVTRVSGFNINGGKKLDIGVYASEK
jgi:hypothetical protein